MTESRVSINPFLLFRTGIITEMKTPILIDTRGIIDLLIAKQNKLVFRGLGRGHS